MKRRVLALIIAWAMIVTALPAVTHQLTKNDDVIQVFTLTEYFGVHFAEQVVMLDLDKPLTDSKNCRLVDGDGQEAPFQILCDGKGAGMVAVVTGLDAYQTLTFTLLSGKSSARFTGGVVFDDSNPSYYEITNGLTGVRVPKPYGVSGVSSLKAPVRQIQYADGSWSGEATDVVFPRGTFTANGMTVKVLEKGAVVTKLEVSYTGSTTVENSVPGSSSFNRPAGVAHYTTTITLQKNQPTVLFETDADVSTRFSLSTAAIHPTYIRVQQRQDNTGNLNTLLPVDYTKNIDVKYNKTGTDTRRNPISPWDPWAYQTHNGWIWTMYNHQGRESDNVISVFVGAASRTVGASRNGLGLYSHTDKDVGIDVVTDISSLTHGTSRFEWRIFAGTNAGIPSYSVLTPTWRDNLGNTLLNNTGANTAVSAMSKQANIHGQGLNLNKLLGMKFDFTDPVRGYGAMYMPKEGVESLIRHYQTDSAFRDYINNASPYYRDIWDMWGETNRGDKFNSLLNNVLTNVRNYINEWANGFGYMSNRHTTQPWSLPMPLLLRCDQLLGKDWLTPQEKKQVKTLITFMGYFCWDSDAWPIHKTDKGVFSYDGNKGNPNMVEGWEANRDIYTMYLDTHPVIGSYPVLMDYSYWNDRGEPRCNSNYMGAVRTKYNALFQRSMLSGTNDYENIPQLQGFLRFMKDLMAPRDIRFGGDIGTRWFAPFSNSRTGSEFPWFSSFATWAYAYDPVTASELMWLWDENGKRHDDGNGCTVLQIDNTLPRKVPMLGNANWEGVFTVLRSNFNTPKETAVFNFNGPWCDDHRDGGVCSEVTIYALGVPLSLNWESMYSPTSTNVYMHNIIVPERFLSSMDSLNIAWNDDVKYVRHESGAIPWDYYKDRTNYFSDFVYSGAVSTHAESYDGHLFWDRAVTVIHVNENYPILYIHDSISGSDAGIPLIKTQSMLADGSVKIPDGSLYTPRFYRWSGNDHGNSSGRAPAGGQPVSLSPGLNKFEFTGQQFGKSGNLLPAIDWDLYEVADAGKQFCIGGWEHTEAELYAKNLYKQVNGTDFVHKQQILRMKGSGSDGFKTLIVPRFKGTTAPTVQRVGDMFVVTLGKEVTRVHDTFYAYDNSEKSVLSSYTFHPASGLNMTVSGGAAEMTLDKKKKTISVTVHSKKNAAGVKLSLPRGNWFLQEGHAVYEPNEKVWVVDYDGAEAVSLLFNAGNNTGKSAHKARK